MWETRYPYSTVSEPYSAEHYNAISSSLEEAVEHFHERNGQLLVNSKIRDCFLKHGVEDTFSACLIHRHFDILPSERNVECDGQARASADLDDAYPSSWMIVNGKLYPYEYTRGGTTPCPPKEFVEEYARILTESGYDDLIGFQVYEPGVIAYEDTDFEAKVSTTINHSEFEKLPEDKEPASWAFFRLPDEVTVSSRL